MSFFDIFRNPGAQPSSAPEADEQAIARYRYLLRTAPPEAIEQAHAEAFAQLTPEQRRRVLEELAADLPDAERNAAWRAGDAPGALARVATRAELREPGAMERAWSRMGAAPGAAPGLGSMFAGSLLAGMAGSVLGTMIAQHFFTGHPEASHLFGASPDPLAAGSLADDPWQRLGSQDLGSAADAPDDISDFDGGMDGGSFDV
ncbi:MAG TPA: hypothetical protein VMN56_13390 [Casimicrobiaceae bacterium]|nr:hypothetical protein [Casimicrobiaceae bacterium]